MWALLVSCALLPRFGAALPEPRLAEPMPEVGYPLEASHAPPLETFEGGTPLVGAGEATTEEGPKALPPAAGAFWPLGFGPEGRSVLALGVGVASGLKGWESAYLTFEWDLDTGELRRVQPLHCEGCASLLAASPDASVLAFRSREQENEIILARPDGQKSVQLKSAVSSAAFGSKGSKLIVQGADGWESTWEVSSAKSNGSELRSPGSAAVSCAEGHPPVVVSRSAYKLEQGTVPRPGPEAQGRGADREGVLLSLVCLPSGGVHAVFGDPQGRLFAEEVTPAGKFVGGGGVIRTPLGSGGTAALTPDGRAIVVAEAGGRLQLVDFDTLDIVWDVETGLELRSLLIRGDGRVAAARTEEGVLLLVDLATGETVRRIDPPLAWRVRLSDEGNLLAAASVGAGAGAQEIRVWDVRAGTLLRRLWSPEPIGDLRLDGAGRRLYVALESRVAAYEIDTGRESLAYAIKGQRGAGLQAAIGFHQRAPVVALPWSDDAGLVASLETGKVLAQVRLGRGLKQMGFDPQSGDLLVIDKQDRAITWTSESGYTKKGRASWEGVLRGDELPAINGPWLVRVRLEPGEGASLFDGSSAPGKTSQRWTQAIGCAAAAPGGRGFVLGGAELWSLNPPGGLGPKLPGWHDQPPIVACTFSGDGRSFAASLADGTVRVFRWPDLSLRASLRASGGEWEAWVAGRLFRHEFGQALGTPGEAGRWRRTEAPPGPLPKLIARVAAIAPPVDGPYPGQVTVRVEAGMGGGAAYGLKVDPGRLPAGVVAVPPEPVAVLAPGQSHDFEVQLSSVNPEGPLPRKAALEMKVVHARGEVRLPMVLNLDAPQPEIARAVVDEDGTTVQVTFRNGRPDGGAPTAGGETGELSASASFVGASGGLDGGPAARMTSLKPGAEGALALAIPDLYRAAPGLRHSLFGTPAFWVSIDLRGSLYPTHRWTGLRTPELVARRGLLRSPLTWLALLAGALGAIAASLVAAPGTLQVVADPRTALALRLREFPGVDRALRWVRMLPRVVATAQLSPARWGWAVEAGRGRPAEAAQAFAEALGGRLKAELLELPPGVAAWELQLPPMHLRFPASTLLVVFRGRDLEVGQASLLAEVVRRARPDLSTVLALDLTELQRSSRSLGAQPGASFVVLEEDRVRDLFFAPDPVLYLERQIASQRRLSELNPYQVAGGLNDDSLFFGREGELRSVLDRPLRNYYLVAARQSGKSSFLKALKRRLERRGDAEVFYISAIGTDLGQALAAELDASAPEGPEALAALASGTGLRPRFWLLDEADAFADLDRQHGFATSALLRKLSEAGRAHFVLAGSWELYRSVALEPLSPLRNFAERLSLGPLDPAAAQALATAPMGALGLDYDAPSTIERLLEETGRRPNLVALACSGMLSSLGPTDKHLSRDLLERVLETDAGLRDGLSFYNQSRPLERAVLRAALLEGERATRTQIRERLERYGARPSSADLDTSFSNLELAYLLVPADAGSYRCPIPLLRRLFRREGDEERRLRDDLEEV